MRLRLPFGVYFLLVFLSGAIAGGLAVRYWMRQPVKTMSWRESHDERRQKYVQEMQTRLKLGKEQLEKFNQILNETHERFRAARERMKPEMESIRNEHVARVRAILDEKQRAEYGKMQAEWVDRIKRER